MRPSPLAVLLVAALLVLGSCGRTGDDTGRSVPPAASSGVPTPTSSPPDADGFHADVEDAVGVAERYWSDRFTAAGVRFLPISDVIAFRDDAEVSCGGQPAPRNNAVYCAAEDIIAYDVHWAVAMYARIGDAFLYYLLGHEYAHGVQVRFGISYRFTIAQELQADCLAGAYIGDSIEAGTLILEDGDIDELRAGLAEVADDPGQPWFAEGAHGGVRERTDAFFTGYEGSVEPCGLPG